MQGVKERGSLLRSSMDPDDPASLHTGGFSPIQQEENRSLTLCLIWSHGALERMEFSPLSEEPNRWNDCFCRKVLPCPNFVAILVHHLPFLPGAIINGPCNSPLASQQRADSRQRRPLLPRPGVYAALETLQDPLCILDDCRIRTGSEERGDLFEGTHSWLTSEGER